MASSSEKQSDITNRWDRIIPAMQQHVDSGEFPGMGLLVYQHGQVIYEEVVGSMDKEANKPLQKDSLVRMYSMTKPITCTALLMLLEEGKFTLDDPVARYIPAFSKTKVYTGISQTQMRMVDPERPMTIRHLFTHTSGLSYGFNPTHPVDQKYVEAKLIDIANYGVQSLEQTVEKIAGLPLIDHPGAIYNYSMSHDVIGYLVSVLADMPFDEFTKKRILDPLGMDDTDFWVPPQKADRLAALYFTGPDGKTTLLAPPSASQLLKPPVAALGGMGLVSTQRDYLRFARMLLNMGSLDGTRLLSRKTVELMTSNHLNPTQIQYMGTSESPNYGFGYGLGVGVLIDRGLSGSTRSNGSYGWGGAAGTDCVIDPQENLIMILMTQRLVAPYPHHILLQNLVYQAIE
jgi:CubicO group peptidase (beta-lactamase class C family)